MMYPTSLSPDQVSERATAAMVLLSADLAAGLLSTRVTSMADISRHGGDDAFWRYMGAAGLDLGSRPLYGDLLSVSAEVTSRLSSRYVGRVVAMGAAAALASREW